MTNSNLNEHFESILGNTLTLKWYFQILRIKIRLMIKELVKFLLISILWVILITFIFKNYNNNWTYILFLLPLVLFFRPIIREISILILIFKKFKPLDLDVDNNGSFSFEFIIYKQIFTYMVGLGIPIFFLVEIMLIFIFPYNDVNFWNKILPSSFFINFLIVILISLIPTIKQPEIFWKSYYTSIIRP